MLVLDVNVLVAAYRTDHQHHELVAHWWAATFSGGQHVVVPDVVLAGFVRIVTSPRIFDVPAGMAEAFDFLDVLVGHPSYVEGNAPRVYDRFRAICLEQQVSSRLVTDAWIAACAQSLGATVVSMDRDLRRFDGLRIVTPGVGG